ncbi:unnamed protein product [Ceutorhynchus assimilis]|uniref:Uncharacterized protein n=1 Tax=Ceutorhynchus assimilis TaxID=467358 RepID=A0A9N9MFF7_9CUCU|nr:unnamed protein product [Ceutorhynchus assimilis]
MSKLSLQSVNTRIDKLADTFQSAMAEFKTQLTAKRMSMENKQVVDFVSDDLVKNFEDFQLSMTEAMSALKSDVQKLNSDNRSFRLKRNLKCLLVHGIGKSEAKVDLYEPLLSIFKNKLNIEISMNDLDIVYRLGKKGERRDKKFPRPILVEFCSRWKRDLVFKNKKHLKGSKIMLTELLTDDNLILFKQAKEKFGKSCWTYGGLVYAEFEGQRKLLRNKSDLQNLW